MADRGLTFGSIATNRSKRRDLIELISVYLIVLLVLWTPRPWQIPLWGVAAAAVMTITCISFDGLQPMGLCTANLFRSLWVVGAALGIAALAVLMAGLLHTLHLPATRIGMLKHSFGYALWACVQQLVLQCFFLARLQRLMPDATMAAALAAVLFAVAHLPSPIMTLITLFCGLAACLFFLRYRNVYPLAMAHAIIGMAIAITIPGPVLHNMRVGLGYITYTSQPAAIAHPSAFKPAAALHQPSALAQP